MLSRDNPSLLQRPESTRFLSQPSVIFRELSMGSSCHGASSYVPFARNNSSLPPPPHLVKFFISLQTQVKFYLLFITPLHTPT